MRVIRANSHAFGTHICNRVRALPTIPSRPETRSGQCIPTRIIHRGHYRPRQDKGFIIDLRLIVTLWITHMCVCVCASVCVRSTHNRCVCTSPIYCSFARVCWLNEATGRPMRPRYLASWLSWEFGCPAKINRQLGIESLKFLQFCSWKYINLTRKVRFLSRK